MKPVFNIRVLIILFLCFFTTVGFAQYENLGTATKVEPKVNPWFVGGMLGGSFSSNGGTLEVSPLVGYRVTPELSVGSRLTYIYSKYNGTSYNDYGASLFTQYRFLNFLIAHVEYEVLNVEYYDINFNNQRRTISSLFIGGGLFQSMGGRGFATISLLYNVLETEYSPYTNPIIRIGFGVGL